MGMYHIIKKPVIGLLLFCSIWMNVHAIPFRHKKLLQPSRDDFYIPPAGFEHEKPGTILKYRPLPHNSFSALSAFPQNLKSIYQILYRTTDGLGDPVATITTVLVPYGADPTKLVSYQVAEDSSSRDCAPSYILQTGTTVVDFSQVEPLLMDNLFRRGWYVSMPDYEGPKALFGVGAMAGKSTLDGIRAVLSSSSFTQIDPLAKIQMWGYSGGSIPVGWAAQLQPSYAPELNIIGAVMGGTVVSPNATINHLRHYLSRTPVTPFYQGFANQYMDFADYMESIIKPGKKKVYHEIKTHCISALMVKYGFENFDSYVTRLDYADHPIFERVFEENIMGQMDVPTIPLFLYHAENDKMTPIAPVEELYRKWCDGGANIRLSKDSMVGHSFESLSGVPNAVIFLEERFGNRTLPTGCSIRATYLSAFNKGFLSVLTSVIWQALGAVFGFPLGITLSSLTGSSDE